jgi:hypothetical protein
MEQPNERDLPQVVMPGILRLDDDIIDVILTLGDRLEREGKHAAATGIYRHFIGELQRFTMVPLATALDDERAVSGLLPNAPVKSTAWPRPCRCDLITTDCWPAANLCDMIGNMYTKSLIDK